jgi:peptidoglycan/xylan/chitin deacetylase (PgdA/CDA1 family)
MMQGPTDQPRIAYTIDDVFTPADAAAIGPLLDAASAANAKLTFFPTGGALDAHRRAGVADIWKRVLDEGHEIGNHSFTHPMRRTKNFSNMSTADIVDELTRTQDTLNEVLGFDHPMTLVRPPGGWGGYRHKVSSELYAAAVQLGMHITMWTLDGHGIRPGDKYIAALEAPGGLPNGAIVLTHFPFVDPASAAAFLGWVHETGTYTATTVSGLFQP